MLPYGDYREGRRRVPPGDGRRRSTRRRGASRPTPAPTTPTSSSSRWAPTTTSPPRRASPRAATSTTPSPAPSGCATRWPTSRAARSSSRSSASRSSARRRPFEGSFMLDEHFTRAGHPRRRGDVDDVPDERPGPGHRRGLADVPRRARRARRRGAPRAPRHGHRPGDQHRAQLASGETLPYDLFVGIPIHRAPAPLADSGLVENSWVPVDQSNLRTRSTASTPSATSAPARAPSPRRGSSPRPPRGSSPTTSPPTIAGARAARALRGLRRLLRRVRRRASSARSRSTSCAATRPRPSATSRRSSSRRRSGVRRGPRRALVQLARAVRAARRRCLKTRTRPRTRR